MAPDTMQHTPLTDAELATLDEMSIERNGGIIARCAAAEIRALREDRESLLAQLFGMTEARNIQRRKCEASQASEARLLAALKGAEHVLHILTRPETDTIEKVWNFLAHPGVEDVLTEIHNAIASREDV